MKRHARGALAASCLILLGAAGKAAKPAFPALRERYVKAYLQRFPVVATYLGASGLDPDLARLDGKLRDLSPAALREEKSTWERFQADLAKLSRAGVPEEDRVDAEVMSSQLAFLLRGHERRLFERALDATLDEAFRGVEWTLQGMAPGEGPKRGTAAEWQRLAERLDAIPGYLRTASTNVRRGATDGRTPDRRLIRSAVATAAASAEYFEKAFPAEAVAALPEGSETLRERIAKGSAAAGRAFREYRRGLLDLFFAADGVALKPMVDRDRFAVGVAEYAWALRNDLKVTKSPQELYRQGREQMARTLLEMTVLARSIAAARGFSDEALPAVVAKLSEEAPKDDEEMLSWYRTGSARLVEFGRAHAFLAVPAEYALDLAFTPGPLRESPGPAYYPAPPLKRTGVGRFYLTPTGNDAELLKQYPRAGVASLAAHEGFPGHDWQYRFLSERSSRISTIRWLSPAGVEDSTSMWADSMATEGWALYAEELVGEARPGAPAGFYTPEEHLFQLQGRLLREARLVVDPGIHCGFLTFDEGVAVLARNVFFVRGPVSKDPARNPDAFERASVEAAEREVVRYARWPTQAVTYLLGKEAILELRAEVKAIEKDAFDERRFHEELLAYGPIPQGLFRETMLEAVRRRPAEGTPR